MYLTSRYTDMLFCGRLYRFRIYIRHFHIFDTGLCTHFQIASLQQGCSGCCSGTVRYGTVQNSTVKYSIVLLPIWVYLGYKETCIFSVVIQRR